MHIGKGWEDIWLFCWDYMILSNVKLFFCYNYNIFVKNLLKI